MAQSAFSAKLQALQARDKALRESRQRQTDIETATAVTGSCQDMCPELERLFREETNQLSAFEVRDNQPDAYAMVKEYRRAGADQSEPLPHELRPGPILSRTMDYLVCNVMDRVRDETTGNEWYDFLWSRTRAIRKDITQQHLCDRLSTDLLEKCTRFHIHCAAALVEEDTTVFDPKINDENLRKCMQSLKDFYHDLSISQAILCPNESEFRAYDILMNLGDSDILREIKHLRPDIINSAPVKFAIDAFFALSSNNFIRFFKLVQKTTYLNACLMHRFFSPIRVQAVRLLRRAVTTPKTAYFYPEEDFIRQLGFDDKTQVSGLCDSLSISHEDGFICLTREDGEMSEASNVPPMRSQSLVESKRLSSVGEVVYGAALPENPYKKYPVHCSFDESGNLKPNALAADSPVKENADIFSPISRLFGQPAAGAAVPKFTFGTGAVFAAEQTQPGFSFLRQTQQLTQPSEVDDEREARIRAQKIGKVSEEFALNTIDEVAADMIVAHVKQEYTDAKMKQDFEQQVEMLWLCVLRDAVDGLIGNIAHCEYSQALKMQQATDFRKKVVDLSKTVSETVVDAAVENGIRETAARVWQNAQNDLLNEMCRKIADRVIENSISKSLAKLSQKVLRDATDKQDRLVQRMVDKRKRKLAIKYWRIWLTTFRKRKKFRLLKQTFPASSLEAGKHVEVVIAVEKNKRPAPVRKSSEKKKKQKLEAKTPPMQVRRSPRSSAFAQCREQIRLSGDKSPAGKMGLLQLKLMEEKEKGIRNDQLVSTVTRALVHTEDSYV